MLNKYSIENHFLTDNNIKFLVKYVTNIDGSIDDLTLNKIKEFILSDLDKIYYCSLEALKNAVNPHYNGIVKYSLSSGEFVHNQNLWETVKFKITDLDQFANTHQIEKNLFYLHLISKGKWLLYFFSHKILTFLNNIDNHCKLALITQCKYCRSTLYQKCQYKLNANYNVKIIQTILLSEVDFNEVEYILRRFYTLANN